MERETEVICGNMRANGARIALQDNATRGVNMAL
jgi:hypothetical protein